MFFCTLVCQSLYLFTLFGINDKSIKNTDTNAYICPNFNPLQGNALKLHVTIISFHLSERGTPYVRTQMHHADANADVRKEGLITADQSDRTNKTRGSCQTRERTLEHSA